MRISRDCSWLGVGLIVIGAAGCDNVDWGGVEFGVIEPPPKGTVATGEGEEAVMGPLPDGPVLFYVRADSAGGTLTPVAEVGTDSLLPLGRGADPELYGSRFIAEYMRRGSEFTLFRRGSRVGTLVVESASVPERAVCRRLPTGRGSLELAGPLAGEAEFLAMAKQAAPDTRGPAFTVEATSGMRRVSPILAERALRARRSQLPGNWQRAMVQVQPFPVAISGDAAVASTFLVDDELQVGNDDQGYSLFLIAVPRRDLTGYDTAYVHHSVYAETGKRAPRVVDFLDWDRDGGAELLLEVFGTRQAWFEAVGPREEEDEWGRLFQEQCDVEGAALGPALPPPDTAAGASAGSGAGGTRPQADTVTGGGASP